MKNFILGLTLLFGVKVVMAATGASLYQSHCALCHGATREGGIGPNLKDNIWLLGEPTKANISQVIINGVTEKGMPAWKTQLSADDITQLVDYITESPNTTPAAPSAIDVSKIRLPKNFVLSVYAEHLENPRSLVVDAQDIVYVGSRKAGKVFALVDKNKDFIADQTTVIARDLNSPNGVTLLNGDLYVAEMSRVLRFSKIADTFTQKPAYNIIKADFPTDQWHGDKVIKAGPDGKLYIPIGSPCNICDRENTQHSKLWRMNPDGSNFEIYARGVRNSVGIAWHPVTQELWFTDNGRDEMGDNLPSCELNYAPKINMHFGFPYCHAGVIPDPEFGKGKNCENYTAPAALLGPHVAPLGLNFYTGKQFPKDYKNQVFIAEHGSWNRSQKIGYQISLVTLYDNKLASLTTFADFLDGETVLARPVDVAFLSDGSMLISDDFGGRIFRVAYQNNVSLAEQGRDLAVEAYHWVKGLVP